MKQRHVWLSALLVIALLLSMFALNSCELLDKFIPDNQGNQDNQDNQGNQGDQGDQGDQGEQIPDDKPDDQPDNPGGDHTGDVDVPALSELDSKFYDAKNWVYMTNNNGASLDGGDIPYTMADGSIKFHRANQAIEMGDFSNSTISFMLKATNDFSIWLNSSSIDNANNSSYRLNYAYGQLRIALSSAPEQAAAVISEENYVKGDWNRFDIAFSTVDGVCEIKVYVNGVRAALSAGDNTTPMVSVADNVLTHTHPAMFSTGNYIVVKVWEAHNFIQLKPVAKAEEEDLPIIACIGASITEGAGAENFYTESYPAQLQNALAGAYNVVNFGNSGKTVRPNLPGGESWLDNYQWTGVQAIVPDITILNIGTNDSKVHHNPTYDGFYKDFNNLVDLLLNVNPDMQIIVCTVPYAYSDIWGISNDNIANIIAPVQRKVAEERGYTLIDLYEYSQGKSHLFPDGVHPNTKGYGMFVKIIKKAILEGGEALTEEFINEINAEYLPKVPGATVAIDSVVIDNMTMTIKGLSNDTGIKLFVGEKPENSSAYYPITVADDSSFEIAFDLRTLAISGDWYNVRIYFTDGGYRTVSLNDAKNGAGESLGLWSWVILENTQIQICSWDENGIPTLSFDVKEYVKPSFEVVITGGSIVEQDGQIILTVNGTTTDPDAVLLVGVSDDPNVYGHAMTIVDGNFTATIDLAGLEDGAGWYNVRIIMSDGNMVSVPYDKLGVNVEDKFYGSGKQVTIKNWSAGDKLTSLFVEKEYFLQGGKPSMSNMPFALTTEGDTAYLTFDDVFAASDKVERTIELLLTTEDPSDNPSSLDASKIVYTAANNYVGDSNTAFSFKIDVKDIGKQSGWMRFVLKVTEGDTVTYYTIKPSVPSHTGDWNAIGSPITVNGIKYELAICWSSLFIQTP